MSKQNDYNYATKLYEVLTKKLNFDTDLETIVKKYIKDDSNEIEIINELTKLLSKNGYLIISIDPLKIEHQ